MHCGAGEPGDPHQGTPQWCPLPNPGLSQIVAQKRVTKPLFLKYGKFAGKSTITVSTEPVLGVTVG